jgi:peptide/nickel transport system permease protein
VFNYPGLGKFSFTAIGSRDYSFIQGQLLLLTCSVLVANLLSDIANVILDPRLRGR